MEKTYSTKVEGMTCGNCALTISKLLEKRGMTNISANAASGEVNFTIVNETEVENVYDAIDSLGYHVVRQEEGNGVVAHREENHKEQRKENIRLLICALLTFPLLLHMFVRWPVLHNPWVQLVLSTPVYIIGLSVFGVSAVRSLKHRLPNMDVLIIIGASAAYVYSLIGLLVYTERAHDYMFFETTAAIITLVMFGNWLEHRTVRSTTAAIDELAKLQPNKAKLVMTDSIGKETITEVDAKYVRTDDVVLVNNGDSIPVDGTILSGEAQIDERMITGESMPARKGRGAEVVGGTIVMDGNLKIKATSVGRSSVLSNIIRMVREAQAIKPPLQKLADRISAIFVPAVLIIAALTLIVNYFFVTGSFEESMMRSIAVLVIACPCAMGLATPAAVAVGLGRAARYGMLVKGGDTLEQLKKIKNIVFDKTGTLTTGNLHISEHDTVLPESEFKSIVTSIERNSSHPLAKSIYEQWKGGDAIAFTKVEEIKGKGMEATDSEGSVWRLGSERWLRKEGGVPQGYDIYLYRNDTYAGALRIEDELRADAKDAITELKNMGYHTVLLSGDKKEKCERIANTLGIEEVYAEQSPEQKNKVLDNLLAKAPTAMVGDGINDAPALAKATVGISLSESTQIAIQSAQIILSNNQLSTLPKAIRLGIYTEQTIKQNLFWAFFYNIVAIPVAAAGYLTPIWGAGIMAMSDVILVLNSLRLGIRRLSSK